MTDDKLTALAARLRDHASDYITHPDDACKHSDLLAAAEYLRQCALARRGRQLLHDAASGHALGRDAEGAASMTIIIEALRAARDMIAIERQSFVDCHSLQEADHDALRIMWTTLDKGHNYVLCVSPRDGGSTLQMDSGMKRIELARMLERFARAAREDARFGGDE